ncbi:MAG TPA: ABC transporter permease [Vicinamibacterales bacterium]|nr:ABC transporter permease [Vicinamibacterales bacterium]
MRHAPPRASRWLLDHALGQDDRSASIRGDLLEEFLARAAGDAAAARRWYRRQALTMAMRALVSRPLTWRQSARRGASPADALWIDLRLAARSLAKAPAFTAASIVTLALGLGAATAVWSVVAAVLVRPLPFTQPDRIMWMTEVGRDGGSMSIAWPDFVDWQARVGEFSDLAGVRPDGMNLVGLGEPERIQGRKVTWNFLRVLGVQPALGRGFAPADDRLGAARVLMLTDGFWRERFGADPGILGRTITLDGVPHEIIGVLPAGFRYNPVTDDRIYEPLGPFLDEASGFLDRGNHNGLSAIGRLKPGVTEAAARQRLEEVAAELTREYPRSNADTRVKLSRVTDVLVGDLGPTVRILFGAVIVLLLLAVVNVANLIVARNLSRQHEQALRAALGCGRWRLVRQLLAESAVMTSVGALLGLLTARGLLGLLAAFAPPGLPRLDEVRMDGVVWAFATVIAAVVALVLGVLPGLQASRVQGQQVLVRSPRGATATASVQRFRRALIVAEVALAMVLVIGAGLVTRSMLKLVRINPGFDPSGVVATRFIPSGDASTPAAVEAFRQRLRQIADDVVMRTRALPGVANAALTLSLPFEGSQWGSVFIVSGQPVPPRADLPSAAFVPVTSAYFDTMRIPVIAGRSFDGRETANSAPTAIVNQAFARRFWPGGIAIGQRVKQSWPEDPTPWREIVGVVGDVKLDGLEQSTPLQVYLPMTQEPSFSMALVARTERDPATVARAIASVVSGAAQDTPVFAVRTMDDLRRSETAGRRLSLFLLVGFGAVALILATIGLHGVVSHGVSERAREVGVRLALGATRGQVVSQFVRQGLATSTAGLVLGGLGTLGLARFARSLLFDVAPTDALTFGSATAMLLFVASVACYLPARRAARVDPTVTLRGE